MANKNIVNILESYRNDSIYLQDKANSGNTETIGDIIEVLGKQVVDNSLSLHGKFTVELIQFYMSKKNGHESWQEFLDSEKKFAMEYVGIQSKISVDDMLKGIQKNAYELKRKADSSDRESLDSIKEVLGNDDYELALKRGYFSLKIIYEYISRKNGFESWQEYLKNKAISCNCLEDFLMQRRIKKIKHKKRKASKICRH